MYLLQGLLTEDHMLQTVAESNQPIIAVLQQAPKGNFPCCLKSSIGDPEWGH